MYTPALFAALVFTALIILFAVFYLALGISFFIWGRFKGAPYVRSKKEKVQTMFELARIRPGEIVLDLGSGDGAIVMEAAKRGAKAVGIEINPFLVWYSRRKIAKENLGGNCHIVRSNFRAYPLNGADVIFIYLLPSILENLKEKFERELKPGCRVVSNAFPIPGWKPAVSTNGVYMYQFADLN